MARWLHSGLRRDVCIAVASLEQPTGNDVKRALEEHYGEAVDAATFRGALSDLVRDGYLDREQDGVHDRYALTDVGERTLREHAEWVETSLA